MSNKIRQKFVISFKFVVSPSKAIYLHSLLIRLTDKFLFSNNKKITWYKMLSRFAPNDILLEEFKTISFNHVLFYKRDTKMYQVIFFTITK